MPGAEHLLVLWLTAKTAAGPLRGSAGAPRWGRQLRLPRGSVPSALRGADRQTQRGAGGGRKLLIPLYLPLALLSRLPVWPAISCSCSRSSLPAWRLPSPRPGTSPLPHPRAPPGAPALKGGDTSGAPIACLHAEHQQWQQAGAWDGALQQLCAAGWSLPKRCRLLLGSGYQPQIKLKFFPWLLWHP